MFNEVMSKGMKSLYIMTCRTSTGFIVVNVQFTKRNTHTKDDCVVVTITKTEFY